MNWKGREGLLGQGDHAKLGGVKKAKGNREIREMEVLRKVLHGLRAWGVGGLPALSGLQGVLLQEHFAAVPRPSQHALAPPLLPGALCSPQPTRCKCLS